MIAGVIEVLLGFVGKFLTMFVIYLKGRSDARLDSYKEALDDLALANTARRTSDAHSPDRLRDSDGFRRD